MMYKRDIQKKIVCLRDELDMARDLYKESPNYHQEQRINLIEQKIKSYEKLLPLAKNPLWHDPIGHSPRARETEISERERRENRGKYTTI